MKRIIIFIYLIVTVFISFTRLYQLHFFVNLLTIFLLFPYKQRISRIFFLFSLFLFPFLLGLKGLYGNSFKDVFRDVFYFQLPFTYSLIGYLISKILDKKFILKYFITAGLLFSVIYLISTLIIFLFSDRFDFYYIRDEVGPGNSVVVILIVLMVFHKKFSKIISIQKFKKNVILILSIITFFFFASRLYILMILIYFLAIKIKSFSVKSFGFLFVFILLFTGIFFLISKNEFAESTFLAKLMRSVNEISVQDYSNPDEMTNNLRGFEVFTAVNDIVNNTSLNQLVFGKGFGTSLELPVTLTIVETEWDSLPVIHNGYFFANLKIGLIGLFATLFFYFNVFKHFKLMRLNVNNYSTQLSFFFSRIGIASVICILLSNIVINGLYNYETGLLQIFIMSLYSDSELT